MMISITYYRLNRRFRRIRIDKEGKPKPDLAKKVSVSSDGLTYTATLRDNLKWSDGSKLSAEDFFTHGGE